MSPQTNEKRRNMDEDKKDQLLPVISATVILCAAAADKSI